MTMWFGVALVVLLQAAAINEAFTLHALSGIEKRQKSGVTMRELSKDEIMSSMTMEKAYQTFMRLNHSQMDSRLVAMIQDKIGGGSQAKQAPTVTGYAAVDKARDMLNDMMDEAIMKRELEQVRCGEYENTQLKILKELEMDIAYVNSEASASKAEVLRCTEIITVIEEEKLPRNRLELSQHNERCRVDIAAIKQQLAIVMADIQVMKNILGMVCADDVRTAKPITLLQTEDTSNDGSLVQCVSCQTGQQAVWLRHQKIQPLLASLQSKIARDYTSDNMLEEFSDEESLHNRVKTVLLQEEEIRKQIPGITIPALANRFNASNPPPPGGACNEQMVGENSSSYMGCQDETVSGRTCQNWLHQSPHRHTQDTSKGGLGDHNYCRNPDGENTIWCYTTDPEVRWEFCEPHLLLSAPTGVSKHECAETNACRLRTPNCEKLQDRFMVIMAGIMDMKSKLSDDLDTLETTCQEIRTSYENTISSLENQLKEEQTNLATASKYMTENQQQSELGNEQHIGLDHDYHFEMSECCDTKNELSAEICALTKIRGELYKMQNLSAYLIDCEVSDWVDGECSKSCGGGKQERTRSIILHPTNGTQCPPLKLERSCNSIGCPVDCEVDDWSAWSDCTAACGGGVITRTRAKTVEPENNGDPCPEQAETRECNTQACNANCVLNDWSEWGLCSKACNSGNQERKKSVKVPTVGQGTCQAWDSSDRLDFQTCNTFSCRDLIPTGRSVVKCSARLDVLVVVDGSGSLGRYGWDESLSMVKKLTDSMLGGDDRVNLGVLLFSGPGDWTKLGPCTGSDPNARPDPSDCGVTWEHHLTSNVEDVKKKVKSMSWPRRTTLTSLALAEVQAELIHGRPDTPSVVVVITDGRPMSPIKTGQAADKLKQQSRLMWVPVGSGVRSSIPNMKKWASMPWQDNVLVVDTFAVLDTPNTLNDMISSFCNQLE